MALEVELKAHVERPLVLKAAIENLPGISESSCELKEDIYYGLSGEEPLFRLRSESHGPRFDSLEGSLLFTTKRKNIVDGIEMNDEREFAASLAERERAKSFCLALGYSEYVRKRKRGYEYTLGKDGVEEPLHIELIEVAPLGWFLEMEILLHDESSVSTARSRLLDLLHQLGLSSEDIEPRYYMHMLRQADGARQDKRDPTPS